MYIVAPYPVVVGIEGFGVIGVCRNTVQVDWDFSEGREEATLVFLGVPVHSKGNANAAAQRSMKFGKKPLPKVSNVVPFWL